jgi:hypothetical protein
MSNVISEHLQYTTIGIEDDIGAFSGTGFLVADTSLTFGKFGHAEVTWERPASRAYLVTARHVLGKTRSEIENTAHYTLRYNENASTGLRLAKQLFTVCNSPANWVMHPDPNIDVAALDVTDWINEVPEGYFRFCPLTELATPMSFAAVDCDAGDEVFVIGYALKLQQGTTSLPLFRKGVLATSPRRRLLDPDSGASLRGFLVDGAIMPGSSGSPVITTSRRFISGDLEVTPYRPLVAGIVAQEWGRGELQRYNAAANSAAARDIEGYANLGFAHSSATIIETIAEFGHHGPHDVLKRDHPDWSQHSGIPEGAIEYEGPQRDGNTMNRLISRMRRDRMRANGEPVVLNEYHDAVDIMGEVPASPQNIKTAEEFVRNSMRSREANRILP